MALGPQQPPSFGAVVPLKTGGSRATLTAQQMVAQVAELRSVHVAFARKL